MRRPTVEEAQLIADMAHSPGWQVLRDLMNEEIHSLITRLIVDDTEQRETIALQQQIRLLKRIIFYVQDRNKQLEQGGN